VEDRAPHKVQHQRLAAAAGADLEATALMCKLDESAIVERMARRRVAPRRARARG